MSRIRPPRSRGAALLLLASLAACGDATGPEEPDLSGTWDAISAVVTNPARPSQSLDLVDAGIALRIVISATGVAEVRITRAGETEIQRGTISTSDGSVTLVLDNEPSEGTYTLRGGILTLDLHTGVQWDFEDDGLDEPATLVAVLVRQT